MDDHGVVQYQPAVPAEPLGIGLVGCGDVALASHLPAYAKWGLPVVGAYDVRHDALARAERDFGVTPYDGLDALLADPAVRVVDVAVRTDDRPAVIDAALSAGKHVLSQKPFVNTLGEARRILRLADESGLTIAVNQNGRWAPGWRAATRWLLAGAVGEVQAIKHDFTTSFDWTLPSHLNSMPHFALWDYAPHWFDITRCWLAGKHITSVRAWDSRAPRQGEDSRTPWNMYSEITCSDGTIATINGTGSAEPDSEHRHRFEIVGGRGNIRGEVLDRESAELNRGSETLRLTPTGSWFPDGFAGTMGELQLAIIEGREPYNSGRHVFASLELNLAAVESADRGGEAVSVDIRA